MRKSIPREVKGKLIERFSSEKAEKKQSKKTRSSSSKNAKTPKTKSHKTTERTKPVAQRRVQAKESKQPIGYDQSF